MAQLNRDVEDDDVFMQLELPLEVFFLSSIPLFSCQRLYIDVDDKSFLYPFQSSQSSVWGAMEQLSLYF